MPQKTKDRIENSEYLGRTIPGGGSDCSQQITNPAALPVDERLGNSAILTIREQANCDPPLKKFT